MKSMARELICIFLVGLFGSHSNAQVLYKPYEVTNTVNSAYAANDFSKIDELAAKMRTSKSRNPEHGGWHLAQLYFAIENGVTAVCKPGLEEQCAKVEEKLNRWVADSPQSPTAPIALAIAQRAHAYAFRGHGYANTVTEKGWQGFHKHLAIAHNTLIKNKKISSADPHWYVEMLMIALSQRWDAQRHWALYEEAVLREPGYPMTYVNAVMYFTPRWGGSMEKVKLFIDDAVRRTASIEGNGMYARLYADLFTDVGWDSLQDPEIWRKLSLGFQDLQKKYPGDWFVNRHAKFACWKGDPDTFIALVKRFEGKPVDEIWPDDLFQKCKTYAVRMRPNSGL